MSYYVLFPFALRFLGTYQVAAEVVNQINLSSYISTFVTLTATLPCNVTSLGDYVKKMSEDNGHSGNMLNFAMPKEG